MMPQREASEQIDATYGRYEGDQTFDRRAHETFYEQPLSRGPADKVYPALPDNKNLLRLLTFVVAIVALFVFCFMCLIIAGGTGGWISFCAACLATFIIAVVVLDKIK